jgi:transposase
MAKMNDLPPELAALSGAQSYTHGFLPLAAAYCRKLGLVELINTLVPSKMNISPGLVVQAMVLDTLSGRSPLYRLEEFLEEQDIELLLGAPVEAHNFNDTNLGRSLDAIFQAGPSGILTEIGIRAAETFGLDSSVVSYDTTSTSVWGDYRMSEACEEIGAPKITHGHSKDKRPDLKQFMTELLCVERGIPIFGRTLDGNSSDKSSNNKMLSHISSIMAEHGLGAGAFVYVADSAMITEANLKELGNNKFVSRLPANFATCNKTITQAVNEDEWIEIGVLAETPDSLNRPAASYKCRETTVCLHGETYRALVVHSDSYDKRRQKKVDKLIARSEKEINAKLKEQISIYSCEADAIKAQKKITGISSSLHTAKAAVTSFQAKRPGRPPKNKPARTVTKYKLEWSVAAKEEVIENARFIAGCFVLVSNVPAAGQNALDSKELLKTYKGQYGVESGFAFLKDPIVVNDTFLKSPHRIDALGMILVISLIIWRLMERSLRTYAKNTGELLPGWENRKTDKPTAFMVAVSMFGVTVLAMRNKTRLILKKPRKKQAAYLKALGLNESVYIDPKFNFEPILPIKKE